MASETKTYPGSKVFLQIGIDKLSLMGRHLLQQLSHLEFHRYSTRTSPVPGIQQRPALKFPLQYDFFADDCLLYRFIREQKMQSHYKQISFIYRNGKEHIKITNKRNGGGGGGGTFSFDKKVHAPMASRGRSC